MRHELYTDTDSAHFKAHGWFKITGQDLRLVNGEPVFDWVDSGYGELATVVATVPLDKPIHVQHGTMSRKAWEKAKGKPPKR